MLHFNGLYVSILIELNQVFLPLYTNIFIACLYSNLSSLNNAELYSTG